MKIKIEGLLKAITPIFHGGDEKTGSTPVYELLAFTIQKRIHLWYCPIFQVIQYVGSLGD